MPLLFSAIIPGLDVVEAAVPRMRTSEIVEWTLIWLDSGLDFAYSSFPWAVVYLWQLQLKLFPQVSATLGFCSGGSQASLWHVGWDARYYIKSCSFSWILQKCISFFFLPFFSPVMLSSQLYGEISCVYVCIGGWYIVIVKFLL